MNKTLCIVKTLIALPFNIAATVLLMSVLPFWGITKLLGANWVKLYD